MPPALKDDPAIVAALALTSLAQADASRAARRMNPQPAAARPPKGTVGTSSWFAERIERAREEAERPREYRWVKTPGESVDPGPHSPAAWHTGLVDALRSPAVAHRAATTPAWISREHTRERAAAILTGPAGLAMLARRRITTATALAVLDADLATADHATGRGVTTSNASVGRRIGKSASLVSEVRNILVRLGLAVTIDRGRYLTTSERDACELATGVRRRRQPSLRAMTLPRTEPCRHRAGPLPRFRAAQPCTDLPTPGVGGSTVPVISRSQRDAHAPRGPLARPRPRNPNPDPGRLTYEPRHPYPLRRFAARLQAHQGYALRRLSPNDVAAALAAAGIDVGAWTPTRLSDALDALPANAKRGTGQARGAGLLIHRLRLLA